MILLVTPNIKGRCYEATNEFSSIHPSMDAAILHSYFTNVKKQQCKMINMEVSRITVEELIKFINYEKIDEVWIICSGSNPSASTMTMPASTLLSARLKVNVKSKIVMYGGHPSSLPELTKQQSGCDEVIVGDGIDCDAKDIPMVDWALLSPNKYKAHNWHCFGDLDNRNNYAVVWTSLGCPYRCKFCSVANMYKEKPFSQRQRRIEDVVDEIEVLNKSFGVKNIRILDELFTYNLERVERFCDLLESKNLDGLNMWCYSRVDTINLEILKKLKKVGFNWIAYGFESCEQETLDLMGKKTKVKDFDYAITSAKSAGINIIADVMAGFPDDNYLSLEKMYKFLETYMFEMINLYPLFHLPGTELYDGSNTDWNTYQLYGSSCKPASTKYLSSSEVLRWRDMAFNRYMTSPAYLSMIGNKFGQGTKEHIVRMMSKNIRVK